MDNAIQANYNKYIPFLYSKKKHLYSTHTKIRYLNNKNSDFSV